MDQGKRGTYFDVAYQEVNLTIADETVPPAPEALGKTARLSGEWSGAVLSPAIQGGQHAWHFYDLDTGYRPNKLIAAGTLPEGRPVDELLMHYDTESKQLVPDANAAFLFVTREGSMGLIETTDRVTRTADLTGLASGNSTPGVGFHKGVRFNLKAIIP